MKSWAWGIYLVGALVAIIGAAYAISKQNDAALGVTVLAGIIAIVGIIAGSVVGVAKPDSDMDLRESDIRKTLKPARTRTVPFVTAVGTAVFLFGFGMACLAGYQAHNLTNETWTLGREFEDYQLLTVIGIMIASIGIGIVTYGLISDDPMNDASMILKSAIVIGAVLSAFCFVTAIWAALVTIHMGVLQRDNYSEYEALRSWSLVGFWVGSLGGVITAYGFSSNHTYHLGRVKKRRRRGV